MRVELPDFDTFTEETDLLKLIRDEAEGRLRWGNTFKGNDWPGAFLVELTRAEPAFEAHANRALAEALNDPSPRVRALALSLMTNIHNRDVLAALRPSFEADPRRFVGVPRPDHPDITLFHDWLLALAHNFTHDREEALRALAAADPYLALPEAGRPVFTLESALRQQQFVDRLPGLLEGVPDDRMQIFVRWLDPSRFKRVGEAMHRATPITFRRFVNIAREEVSSIHGPEAWNKLAAELGVEP